MEVRGHARLELAIRDLHVEPVAQRLELTGRHLLDLVRRIARLEVGTERPALHRLGEDDGRGVLVLDRRLVRGKDLPVVVPAARQPLQLVVRHVLDHLAQTRIRPEEVLTDIRARLDGVLLELAVDGRVHLVHEHAVDVAGEELVPLAAPDDLQDVPAHAAECRFELLDDLAVAPNGTVEPLQIAVDHEDQVVEPLAGREVERRGRLRFVELAVAHEAPHARARRVNELAVVEVTVEPRLVHRVERSEPHRYGRVLPEGREPARVRVRRQSPAACLAPEVVELIFGEPSLQERARVDAGGRVTLEVDLVAETAVALAAEEMVEADLVQRRRRRVRREVTAQTVETMVRAVDHRDGVPTYERADATFDVFVAGEPRLLLGRDGVDVIGRDHRGHERALLARAFHESREQVVGARLALHVDHRVERLQPLAGLLGVDIRELMDRTVAEHAPLRPSTDHRLVGPGFEPSARTALSVRPPRARPVPPGCAGFWGGRGGIRTPDPLRVMQVLCQTEPRARVSTPG